MKKKNSYAEKVALQVKRKKKKQYSLHRIKKRAPRQALQEKRISQANVYLAAPELSGALFDEMKYCGVKECIEITPGIVINTEPQITDYIFARQVLPNAQVVYGLTVNELAQNFFKELSEEHQSSFLASPQEAEIFSPFTIRAPRGQAKKNPLQEDLKEFASIIEKKRVGRAAKFEIAAVEHAQYRVQIVLLSTTELWYSFERLELKVDSVEADSKIKSSFAQWPSPFIGGVAPLPEFPKAPSSAYRKLAEAFCLSGDFPHKADTVLDLGGVPGGWSYLLLEYGATVITVDRGTMDPDLLLHPNLTHIRKDAFTHTPFEQGTFAVCDIIDVPQKILGLLEQAKDQAQIRAMIFTIKLKRPIDVPMLKKLQKKLALDLRFESRLKHLVHNKAEVTLILKRL